MASDAIVKNDIKKSTAKKRYVVLCRRRNASSSLRIVQNTGPDPMEVDIFEAGIDGGKAVARIGLAVDVDDRRATNQARRDHGMRRREGRQVAPRHGPRPHPAAHGVDRFPRVAGEDETAAIND